jgi:hypothetical protein
MQADRRQEIPTPNCARNLLTGLLLQDPTMKFRPVFHVVEVYGISRQRSFFG